FVLSQYLVDVWG
ncbi:hypothetical protein EC5412_1577, partial [Escherichia coli 5412]